VEVLRNGHTENLKATVGELEGKKELGGSSSNRGEGGKYGMSVEPLTPEIAEQIGVPRGTQGVVIDDVDEAGLAADSGLAQGDVIEKVDGKPVKTGEELKAALDRNDGKPSLLLVHRKDATIFLTLRSN